MKIWYYRIIAKMPPMYRGMIPPSLLQKLNCIDLLNYLIVTDDIISFWIRHDGEMMRFNKQDLVEVTDNVTKSGSSRWNTSGVGTAFGGLMKKGKVMKWPSPYAPVLSDGRGNMSAYTVFQTPIYK